MLQYTIIQYTILYCITSILYILLYHITIYFVIVPPSAGRRGTAATRKAGPVHHMAFYLICMYIYIEIHIYTCLYVYICIIIIIIHR